MPANDRSPGTPERHTLTRAEVAARLGISTSSVRRLEWDRLHPEQDARGVWRFDPAELEGFKPRSQRSERPASSRAAETREVARRGRLAARVFRMFARHMTLPQIVVQTKQPPEIIRALYHEWATSLDEGEWQARDHEERLEAGRLPQS